jgi:hypothetical protein
MFRATRIVTIIAGVSTTLYIGHQLQKSNIPLINAIKLIPTTPLLLTAIIAATPQEISIDEVIKMVSKGALYDSTIFTINTNKQICAEIAKSNPEYLYKNFDKLYEYIPEDFITNINNKSTNKLIANGIINGNFLFYDFKSFPISQKIVKQIIKIDSKFIVNNKSDFTDIALPAWLFEQIVDGDFRKLIVLKQFDDDKSKRHYGYEYKDGINKVPEFDPNIGVSQGFHFTNAFWLNKHAYICDRTESCGIFEVGLDKDSLYSYNRTFTTFKGQSFIKKEKISESQN